MNQYNSLEYEIELKKYEKKMQWYHKQEWIDKAHKAGKWYHEETTQDIYYLNYARGCEWYNDKNKSKCKNK